MKTILALAVSFATILTTLTGYAADPAPADNAIVARVNSKEIKRGELNAAMRGLMMQFAQEDRSIPPQQIGRAHV